MVEISEALTRKTAELARLRLSESEIAEYTTQLGKVLQYIDLLQEVDVEGIEPMGQPHLSANAESALRPDVAVPFARGKDGEPKVLDSAPEVQDGAFQVPQIV